MMFVIKLELYKILTVIVCSSDNSSNISGSMFTVTKAKDDFMVDLLKFLD